MKRNWTEFLLGLVILIGAIYLFTHLPKGSFTEITTVRKSLRGAYEHIADAEQNLAIRESAHESNSARMVSFSSRAPASLSNAISAAESANSTRVGVTQLTPQEIQFLVEKTLQENRAAEAREPYP